jgi:hypothetical protein
MFLRRRRRRPLWLSHAQALSGSARLGVPLVWTVGQSMEATGKEVVEEQRRSMLTAMGWTSEPLHYGRVWQRAGVCATGRGGGRGTETSSGGDFFCLYGGPSRYRVGYARGW